MGRLAASARRAGRTPAAITTSSLRLWGSQAVGEKAEGLHEAAQEAVAATGAGKHPPGFGLVAQVPELFFMS